MEEQLGAHVEPIVEEDTQPSFGLAIGKGKHREHMLGFQHSLLQRHADGTYSVVSPPLRIGLREAKSPRPIFCVVQASEMRRHELRKVQHSQDGGFVQCTRFQAFDPSLGVGWREILS